MPVTPSVIENCARSGSSLTSPRPVELAIRATDSVWGFRARVLCTAFFTALPPAVSYRKVNGVRLFCWAGHLFSAVTFIVVPPWLFRIVATLAFKTFAEGTRDKTCLEE
jgi:hypothetical protein